MIHGLGKHDTLNRSFLQHHQQLLPAGGQLQVRQRRRSGNEKKTLYIGTFSHTNYIPPSRISSPGRWRPRSCGPWAACPPWSPPAGSTTSTAGSRSTPGSSPPWPSWPPSWSSPWCSRRGGWALWILLQLLCRKRSVFHISKMVC